MQIRFPRRIRLGFRPVYGLTIRQLIYLAGFGIAGGLVILAGSFQEVSLIARAIVGLLLIVAGLTLTFLRVSGLALDEWLPIGARYLFRPRRRVWRKRDVRRPTIPSNPKRAPDTAKIPSANVPNAAPMSMPAEVKRDLPRTAAAVALTNVFVLAALAALTVYLHARGLDEIQIALARLMR